MPYGWAPRSAQRPTLLAGLSAAEGQLLWMQYAPTALPYSQA